MFQWLYEFFMTYFMPMVTAVLAFLGIDQKKVHFEDAEPEQAEHKQESQ